jgi:hypothetical protein
MGCGCFIYCIDCGDMIPDGPALQLQWQTMSEDGMMVYNNSSLDQSVAREPGNECDDPFTEYDDELMEYIIQPDMANLTVPNPISDEMLFDMNADHDLALLLSGWPNYDSPTPTKHHQYQQIYDWCWPQEQALVYGARQASSYS